MATKYGTIDGVKDKHTRNVIIAMAEVFHNGNVQEVIDLFDARAEQSEAQYLEAKRLALLQMNEETEMILKLPRRQ